MPRRVTIPVQSRFPRSFKSKFDKLAKRRGWSRSKAILFACQEFVGKREREDAKKPADPGDPTDA